MQLRKFLQVCSWDTMKAYTRELIISYCVGLKKKSQMEQRKLELELHKLQVKYNESMRAITNFTHTDTYIAIQLAIWAPSHCLESIKVTLQI